MNLSRHLRGHRSEILSRWIDVALRVYPEETVRFIRREKDRFRNPVGYSLSTSLDVLLEGLLDGRPTERLEQALDGIVRLRAVQDLAPSRALEFVLPLKRLIREECADAVSGEHLAVLDERIDGLSLAAFDHYVRCREKVCDLRVNEMKRQTSKLFERLERANGSVDDRPSPADPKDRLNGGCGA